MKKFYLLILLVFVSVVSAFSQHTTGTIKGTVAGNSKSIEAATVTLLKAADKASAQMVLTNAGGQFELSAVAIGKYQVQVSAIGFATSTIPVEVSEKHLAITLPEIKLTVASQSLKDVTVVGKKQFVEQKLDRTLINVDASPTNTGLTALEVLEKSPGISVDRDGNISLKGKQGVLVMMDGKPTYLNGTDLTNLLKNMPATQLEQIEIMPNPPAKYDAAGNSGIINIKTKKNKTQGLNGSISLGAGYSVNPKTNNSLNLNYRTGKFNFFTNYSYNWNKGRQTLNLNRVFPDTLFTQTSRMVPNFQNHSFKVGADYYASKKTTLGVVFSGFENPGVFTNNNTTLKFDKNGTLGSRTETASRNQDKWTNRAVNLNLRHVFDSTGRELSADVDYITYTSSSLQSFGSNFYDKEGARYQVEELFRGQLPSEINITSAKVDYSHPLKGNAKIEAGAKTSFVNTDNNALYANFYNGVWVPDAGRSNHFLYKENINAVYINTSKEFNKKWSGQLGLRIENTNATGDQLTTGENFKRNYTQAFPTAYIGYKANDKNQLALSFGRRIERPGYRDMNPFYYFLDKYTYQVGNPYLRPQFSNNIELNHSFRSFLNTSLSYSTTNDILQEVLEQIDSISTSFVKKSNIAKRENVSLSVSANIPVAKWWRANIYTNVFYNHFTGAINNGPIDVKGIAVMGNISNSFTFKKGWGGEVSGFYRSKAIEGTLVAKSMGAVNMAISKQVLKNKGTLRLNVRDVFFTQQFRGYSKFQNIDVTIHNRRDSRVVNLGFTYRFGKQQKAPQRKKGGAGDEESRVNAGSN